MLLSFFYYFTNGDKVTEGKEVVGYNDINNGGIKL